MKGGPKASPGLERMGEDMRRRILEAAADDPRPTCPECGSVLAGPVAGALWCRTCCKSVFEPHAPDTDTEGE